MNEPSAAGYFISFCCLYIFLQYAQRTVKKYTKMVRFEG